MASLFTTIYFFAYSSQSLNITLSCLLRTLALSVHLWFTCNLAEVFCHILLTYSVTGYGPRPLDASQTSTLITMSISAPTLTKANNALLPASCLSQHPKSFSIGVLPCRAHSAIKQTTNNTYNELHASFIVETAGNASVNHISSASHSKSMPASIEMQTLVLLYTWPLIYIGFTTTLHFGLPFT
jgi:hypothetical protein